MATESESTQVTTAATSSGFPRRPSSLGEATDSVDGGEGTFSLCSFCYVEAQFG